MGHLHGGRVVIAISGNYFDAITLKLNGDFFAQFARAQQQYLGGTLC